MNARDAALRPAVNGSDLTASDPPRKLARPTAPLPRRPVTHFLCDPLAAARPRTLSGGVVSLTECAHAAALSGESKFADGGPAAQASAPDALSASEEAAYERLVDWSLRQAGERMARRRRVQP